MGEPVPDLVTAYLGRLGYADRPGVSVEELADLHRRHLAAVPYENLSIMLGEPPSVDPLDSLGRVAAVGRAGYCFHQNGALEVVLDDLGYTVSRRGGHVWTSEEDRWTGSLNHLVLVVSRLPTEDNPGGDWWPDVGLGDALLEPLPLVVGDYAQGGFRYALTEVRADGWSFRAAASGSFTGLEVGPAPSAADIEACHASLSTPPDGRFAKLAVVQRRLPSRVDVVRGCVWQQVTPDRVEEADLTTYDDWRAAIADGCGLSLAGIDDAALRGLFDGQLALHRAWVEAGRP
jgi:arylamine N-acetyltransferase